MGTRPSVPSSPAAPSPVLVQMPPARSLPRADEASQSPAKSILRQLDYLPTSSILAQLDNICETHEDYALKQQSLGISARQDLEADAYEDRIAETESQYPINSLPEARGSYSPESANQGNSNQAQDDCEIGSKAQRCQMDDS
ncbi:homeodomain-like protein, partial [Lasius niger]